MGIISRLTGKATSLKQELWQAQDQPRQLSATKNNDLYRAVYANVRVKADYVGQSEIYYTRKGSETEVKAHWLINLLQSPYRGATSVDLLETISASMDVSNNTFIIFEYGTSSKPIAARVAVPGQVKPEVRDGVLIGYKLSGSERILNENEYLKIGSRSPLSAIEGVSPLNAVSEVLKVEHFINLYQLGFFTNNAVPSGLVTIESDKATFENIKNQWAEDHRGAGNNNKVRFARKEPGGNALMSFEKYVQDNNSLEMQTLFDRVDKKVDEAFGVPREMKGTVQSSNLAGVKVAKSIFIENTISPVVNRIERALNSWIGINFPTENIEVHLEVRNDEDLEAHKLEADTLKVKAETASIMINTGFNKSQVLALLEIDDMEYTEPVKPEPQALIPQEITQPTKSTLKKGALRIKSFTNEDFEDTDTLEEALDKFFNAQYKRVDGASIDIESETTKLAAVMSPFMLSILRQSGAKNTQEFLKEIGITDNIRYELSTQLRSGTVSYTKRVAEIFNSTTQNDLEKIKQAGDQFGYNQSQVKSEIRKYYKSQGPYIMEGGKEIKNNVKFRTERLVRTEVGRVNNAAAVSAAENIENAIGVTIYKVWRRTGSEPEPICDALEGTRVRVGTAFLRKGETLDLGDSGEFTNDYGSMFGATAHPNCECLQEFEVE